MSHGGSGGHGGGFTGGHAGYGHHAGGHHSNVGSGADHPSHHVSHAPQGNHHGHYQDAVHHNTNHMPYGVAGHGIAGPGHAHGQGGSHSGINGLAHAMTGVYGHIAGTFLGALAHAFGLGGGHQGGAGHHGSHSAPPGVHHISDVPPGVLSQRDAAVVMAKRIAMPLLYPVLILGGMIVWLTMLYVTTHQPSAKPLNEAPRLEAKLDAAPAAPASVPDYSAAFGVPDDPSASIADNAYSTSGVAPSLPDRMQSEQPGILAMPPQNAVNQPILQGVAGASALGASPQTSRQNGWPAVQPLPQQGQGQGQANANSNAAHVPPRVVFVNR